MGDIIGALPLVGNLFRGKKDRKTSDAPTKAIDDASARTRRTRAQVIATKGGQAGQELQPGQVAPSGNIFGN